VEATREFRHRAPAPADGAGEPPGHIPEAVVRRQMELNRAAAGARLGGDERGGPATAKPELKLVRSAPAHPAVVLALELLG
jgi:hypothetical protein